MDGVSWTDLDPDEQRAIALLGAGVSVELCDRVALLTLARLGLVRGGQLTPAADQLRRAAILHELVALAGSATTNLLVFRHFGNVDFPLVGRSARNRTPTQFPFPVACNYFSGSGRSLTTGPLTIGIAWTTGAFGTSILSTRLSDL